MTKQPDPGGDESVRAHLAEELRAGFAEAQAALRAEVTFQAARARLAGRYLARIAKLIALALALVFFALMALVVGTLLALTPPLGIWGATLAVVAGLLLATGLMLLAARSGWRRLLRLFTSQDHTP